MRKYFIAFIAFLGMQATNAQVKKDQSSWMTEVGPSFAIPIRTLHTATSFAIGGDLKISKMVSSIENFSIGGRASYNIFFAKKQEGLQGHTINNIGLFASFQYIALEKIILEGDIGLGISTNWFNTLGLARGGFIGYKLPDSKRNIKVGFFMNRITFATLHFGIKGTIQI